MRLVLSVAAALAVPLVIGSTTRATIIASDSFLTTATTTSGYYVAGNINMQTATNGTTGYYSGAAVGSQVAGWNSGTSAESATTTALTNPLVVNAATGGTNGSLNAVGNGNSRLQYRDLANVAAPASSNYYFSLLTRESVNSYTGVNYAGLGSSRASGGNAVVPSNGFDIGYVNGALTLFYNNGGASLSTAQDQKTLLATPTAGATYLVEVAASLTGTTATLTPKVYDSTGTLVNTPASQTVTGTLDRTVDMGAFQGFVSSEFTGGSPSNVLFDEFRFGTAEADVIATPEPVGLSALAAVGGMGLLARRRRRT